MKKILAGFIVMIIFIGASPSRTHAISEEQFVEIESLLNESTEISGAPGMSVSIIDENETYYFSSGYADREKGTPATENTLYELASVSKAFTGVGILLLEEQGFLSMTDPIQKYLPWISFNYKGRPIDMQTLTLNHFLHHTSGLTNEKHFQDIPQGSSEDKLLKTVEILKDTELEFSPGQKYQYGTINYDVLGLVIEIVSSKSFERFMTDEVFHPLELNHTYLYRENAQETGQMAQGYRTSFFMKSPYDAPDYAGNKPAGYMISDSKDMARWMGIQLGTVEDIPDIFKRVIVTSHNGNQSVSDDNGLYYGAGWLINSDKSFIEHDGVNPTFSTQVFLFTDKKRAISLLTNSATPNNSSIVENINNILEGETAASYQKSALEISDMILSIATITFTLLTILIFILSLKKRNPSQKLFLRKNRKILISILTAITFTLFVVIWVYPMFIGYNWTLLLVWQPYSLVTALISLAVFSASITWFVWQRSK